MLRQRQTLQFRWSHLSVDTSRGWPFGQDSMNTDPGKGDKVGDRSAIPVEVSDES
jgi:hypothetical protein